MKNREQLRTLKKDDLVTTLPADKGRVTVAMNANGYYEKCIEVGR